MLEEKPAKDFRNRGAFISVGSVWVKIDLAVRTVSFLEPGQKDEKNPFLRIALMKGFPISSESDNRTTYFGEIVRLNRDRMSGRMKYFVRGEKQPDREDFTFPALEKMVWAVTENQAEAGITKNV